MIAAVLCTLFAVDRLGGDESDATQATDAQLSISGSAVKVDTDADDKGDTAGNTAGETSNTPAPQDIVPGGLILPKPKPKLVKESDGRLGTGIVLAGLRSVEAPVGKPVTGTVSTAVANIPNRTSTGGFNSAIRTLVSGSPDFVMLNEVSKHSTESIKALAPGYDAYRDEQPDRTQGGAGQSMNNVVMWRDEVWTLVDAGRIKVVNDDRGYLRNKPFTWDRYATWTMLQRKDGAIISVISTHMPTNPARYPKQPGGGGLSRVARYGMGMDVLVDSINVLAKHGPVIVGGDMNSHPTQGSWTAAAKMSAAGFSYAKDRGVMYLFYQRGVTLESHRQVGIASDHPAIVSTLSMNGATAARG